MAIFWVNFPQTRADGKPAGCPFETEAHEVDELVGRLTSDIIVAGHKLILSRDSNGGRVIEERVPMAITAKGIASVNLYDFEISADHDPL